MNFPSSIEDALDQIDVYVIENLMPPPHYKYRLNALMSQQLLQWDVGKTNKIPELTIHLFRESIKPSVDPNRKIATLKRTGLMVEYNKPEFNKFIGISNE